MLYALVPEWANDLYSAYAQYRGNCRFSNDKFSEQFAIATSLEAAFLI